jgi:phage baseplate assembly protein W
MKKVIGIKFPFSRGVDGIPQKAVDIEAKRSEIIQILKTRKGERVMRPTFGSNLWSIVFSGEDVDVLKTFIETDIRTAISVDPSIEIEHVEVVIKDTDAGRIVEVDVDFVYRGIKETVKVEYGSIG